MASGPSNPKGGWDLFFPSCLMLWVKSPRTGCQQHTRANHFASSGLLEPQTALCARGDPKGGGSAWGHIARDHPKAVLLVVKVLYHQPRHTQTAGTVELKVGPSKCVDFVFLFLDSV